MCDALRARVSLKNGLCKWFGIRWMVKYAQLCDGNEAHTFAESSAIRDIQRTQFARIISNKVMMCKANEANGNVENEAHHNWADILLDFHWIARVSLDASISKVIHLPPSYGANPCNIDKMFHRIFDENNDDIGWKTWAPWANTWKRFSFS